ncbi:SAM domain (Sterile alpha motif) [Gracilaria domingensis]|nr:SAM domain (Sterile alpha motif) [Gracilaria domingensis]
MAYNRQHESCPSCTTPLTLFTPRERIQHINECLDSRDEHSRGPDCAVCHRNLNSLTLAARQEHVNRCLDVRQPGRRQPQPVRKRPRSTVATSSRVPIPSRRHKQCDKKVSKLLTLLGLERYAQRFADEEIDMDTLRILKDEDFVSLRIPDAARRRIADALQAVPILERLQEPGTIEVPDKPPIVPTQKFSESKLAASLRRRSCLFDSDDDEEYRPTQTAFGTAEEVPHQHGDSASPEHVSQSVRAPESLPVTIDLITPTKKDPVDPGVINDASDRSAESDFDFEKDIIEESQISLEKKVEEWRTHQIRKETKRHEGEMRNIEAKYRNMMARLVEPRRKKSPVSSLRPENVACVHRNARENQIDFAAIDLTTELSDESKERTKSGSVKEKDENERRLMTREKVTDELKANPVQVLDCCSDSDNDFLREQVLRSPPRGYRIALPDLDYGSESDGIEDLSQRARLGSTKLLLATNENESDNEHVKSAKVHQDTSNSNVLDPPDEQSPGKREAAELGRSMRQGLFLNHSGEDSSSSEVQQRRRSRLKKKRIVTHEEISAAIRKDKSLYDRILKVESVSYEVILRSIRVSGTAVSRKALTKYLHSEGIMYKGETTSKTSKAYLNGLNSEF